MKKTLVFILALTFLLTGCAGQETTLNSSNISSTASINPVSSLVEEASDIYTCIDEPQYFPFSCDTVDDFILWSKKGGNVKAGLNSGTDNPGNQPYLKWVKNRSSIFLPKLKNNDFYLNHIYVEEKYISFGYPIKENIKKDLLHDRFDVVCYFLDEKQSKMELAELEKTFNLNNDVIDIEKGTCRWGEYHYVRSKETGTPIITFISSSMLYKVGARKSIFGYKNNQPWQDEYFDYFDFETVSLK